MALRNTLYSWFLKGMKPTAQQWQEVFKTFWSKDEDVLQIQHIDGLDNALNGKAAASDVALKANATDVYPISQTYTRTEINNLVNGSFKGSATTSTNPGAQTSAVWYIASGAGTYTNFLSAAATPIVVGASDGFVVFSYNVTTGYWVKGTSPFNLANYYTISQADAAHDPQKNTLGVWFNKPIYETDSSNRIYFKPTAHATMGDGTQVFFIRGGFYADYNCDWTKVKTDLTGITGVTINATAPSGTTDCIRVDATYAIWFDPATKIFSGGGWIKKTNKIKLLENNYGIAGDCTERNAANIAIKFSNPDPQINSLGTFFSSPYYEVSGTTIYFNCAAGFFIRGGVFTDISRSWTLIKSDINAGLVTTPAPGIVVGVTSPLGVADCIRIDSANCIWYNPISNVFFAGAVVAKKTGWVKMIHNNAGLPADCIERAAINHQILKNTLPATTYVDLHDRWLIDSILFNNYNDAAITLEEEGIGAGRIWLKVANTGGAVLYFRGISGTQINTWTDFITRMQTDFPTVVFETSPKGVPDCLRLNHTEAIAYNYLTSKFEIIGTTANNPKYNTLVHCENGRVGRLTRNLHIYRKSIENKMATQIATTSTTMKSQVLPLAKSYTAGPNATSVGFQRFTFIHITDIHYSSTNADANMQEMLDFSTDPLVNTEIKAIFSTGDVSNGTGNRNKATTIAELQLFTNRLVASPKVTLNIVGNHDDNINYGSFPSEDTAFAAALTKADQYLYCIKPFKDKWPLIQTVTDKCYYYYDFTVDKIRVIALDFVDLPITEGATAGTLKYVGGYYFSQAQLDWLYSTLQSVPSDYGVIIMNHGPSTVNDEVGYYLQGRDMIFSIINAFKNGTSYNHSYVHPTYSELNTTKVFDFTSNGAKEFICHLSGHIHSVKYLNPAAFPDQNVIVTGCLFSGTSYDLNLIRDTNNEELKNCFNVISVDRNLKKIFSTTFGAYRDGAGNNLRRTKTLSY